MLVFVPFQLYKDGYVALEKKQYTDFSGLPASGNVLAPFFAAQDAKCGDSYMSFEVRFIFYKCDTMVPYCFMKITGGSNSFCVIFVEYVCLKVTFVLRE